MTPLGQILVVVVLSVTLLPAEVQGTLLAAHARR